MRTKSKYRRQAFKDGGAVHDVTVPVDAAPETPAPEAPPVPAELPPAPAVDKSPPQPEPPEQPRQDGATLALRRQIESLRQSEQHQRQPQEPMSREQRLAVWKADGLSDAEVHLIQRNPEMIDHPQILGFAVQRAKEAGIQRGTEAHLATVEQIFNSALSHLQAQAEQPAMPETPTFFEPPAPRSGRNPSSLVSAPVSRDVPTGSGRRSTPGKITLTPSEVEHARVSGLSPEEYALQLLKYREALADGSYRDSRETQR